MRARCFWLGVSCRRASRIPALHFSLNFRLPQILWHSDPAHALSALPRVRWDPKHGRLKLRHGRLDPAYGDPERVLVLEFDRAPEDPILPDPKFPEASPVPDRFGDTFPPKQTLAFWRHAILRIPAGFLPFLWHQYCRLDLPEETDRPRVPQDLKFDAEPQAQHWILLGWDAVSAFLNGA